MFTFKTEKATGSYASFFPHTHYIKLKKRVVGQIDDETPYKIRLKIKKEDINEDGNPNCDWRWITLKKESQSLDEAKQFLKDNYAFITHRYKLKSLE